MQDEIDEQPGLRRCRCHTRCTSTNTSVLQKKRCAAVGLNLRGITRRAAILRQSADIGRRGAGEEPQKRAEAQDSTHVRLCETAYAGQGCPGALARHELAVLTTGASPRSRPD